MNTRDIFKILDLDIRLNYNSKADFSNKIGFTRQRFSEFLKILKSSKERNSFNVICNVLEKSGKRIIVVDENGKEIKVD